MSGPPSKKPMRPKAKRSPARVAGSKKAPANAAFLTVPEKAVDRTPPMTAAFQNLKRTSINREAFAPARPALTVTLNDDGDGDEDGDVVPELVRRAESPRSSVSESTLWEHVGLQAGLSVSTATVPYPGTAGTAGSAAPDKKKC
ncbi:uncharacterized protein LOC117652744 [Thrips palmi]|uniref:Uncharacterized protein LOC117652744 n=1 Tax=Thrips palmi TaxID=161013 RepID=A0A6P9A728_THRPL|nr:uncharacterized protein LOC117652744 [Thrips palmi]